MRHNWSTLMKIRGNLSTFFDQLFECELCLEPDGSSTGICEECLNRLPYMGLACPQCSESVSTEGLCGRCQRTPPAYDYSYCSLSYEHPLPHWLHRCKDKRDTRQISRIQTLMLMARPALDDQPENYPDMVTCIPTSHRRRLWRGFNLSEELARAVAHDLGLPFHRLLKKTKHQEQRGRSARQRASSQTDMRVETNLNLAGKHILIVDDVMTTGSTLHTAAALLKESNAQKVGAWCFARTPKTR